MTRIGIEQLHQSELSFEFEKNCNRDRELVNALQDIHSTKNEASKTEAVMTSEGMIMSEWLLEGQKYSLEVLIRL
jgi:hypothetical protein